MLKNFCKNFYLTMYGDTPEPVSMKPKRVNEKMDYFVPFLL